MTASIPQMPPLYFKNIKHITTSNTKANTTGPLQAQQSLYYNTMCSGLGGSGSSRIPYHTIPPHIFIYSTDCIQITTALPSIPPTCNIPVQDVMGCRSSLLVNVHHTPLEQHTRSSSFPKDRCIKRLHLHFVLPSHLLLGAAGNVPLSPNSLST